MTPPAAVAGGSTGDRAVAAPPPPREIAYRAAFRPGGVHAGAHATRQAGIGGLVHDVVPLVRHPDPRRLDIARSARDVFGALYVRRHAHRSTLDLHILVDASGSMGFAGTADKRRLVTALAECLAASATRIGDGVSLALCGRTVDAALSLPLTRRRSAAAEVAGRLAGDWARGAGSPGLLAAALTLPRRRSMVFLVSDFRLPFAEVEAILAALAPHDVVPIEVADPAEIDGLPRWGLVELADLETGGRRLLLMRPSLHDRLVATAAERRARLDRLCRRHGRPLFRLSKQFDAVALERHLLGVGP